jgi:hypothetical protein
MPQRNWTFMNSSSGSNMTLHGIVGYCLFHGRILVLFILLLPVFFYFNKHKWKADSRETNPLIFHNFLYGREWQLCCTCPPWRDMTRGCWRTARLTGSPIGRMNRFFCCRLLWQFLYPPPQSTALCLRRSYSFFSLCSRFSLPMQADWKGWRGWSKIIRKQKSGNPNKKIKRIFKALLI